MYLPIDVHQIVSKFLKLKNTLKLFLVNKHINNNLKILKITESYKKLNDEIIKQNKFSNLSDLMAEHTNVTNVNHLKNLKVLFCGSDCNITDNGLCELKNIETLCLRHNNVITKISHLTKLTCLDIYGGCIKNEELENLLNIEWLNICCNTNITNISYLTKIKTLSGNSNIHNENIKDLKNIEDLYINSDVTDMNHLAKLKYLTVLGDHLSKYFSPVVNNISNNNIFNLKNLVTLVVDNIKGITDVNHLVNLEVLSCEDNSGIDNNGIKKLKNLKKLRCSGNSKVSDVNHLVKLEKLSCECESGIDNNGIKKLKNLKKLKCCGNSKVYDINHLVKLEKLKCSNTSINDTNIKNLINLIKIDISSCGGITIISHLVNLKIINFDFKSKVNRSVIEKIKTHIDVSDNSPDSLMDYF